MKRNMLILCPLLLVFFFNTSTSFGQGVILNDSIIRFYNLFHKIVELDRDKDSPESIHKAYLDYFNCGLVPESVIAKNYSGYADELAAMGDLDKAVVYYDKAFYSKHLLPSDFNIEGIRKWFSKDTALFQLKVKEYQDNFGKIYSYQELQIINELYSMLSADQLSRQYCKQHPDRSLLMFSDSLTMQRMIALIQNNASSDNPLKYVKFAYFVLGRHAYSCYPKMWLQYIEPMERQWLIEGKSDNVSYARNYDQAIIYATGEKSYFGEFDDYGNAANPDTATVNRHRINIGLPPLKEKKESNSIFITY